MRTYSSGRQNPRDRLDIYLLTLPCYDNTRGVEDIEVGLDVSGETIEESSLCLGNICGEEVQGRDCGPQVSDWLENVLGLSGVKLVRGVRRNSARSLGSTSTSLANDSSCLVVSQASVALLAREVRERCTRLGEDWDQFTELSLTQRFRANIVVSADQPFLEETWQHFTAGGRTQVSSFSQRGQKDSFFFSTIFKSHLKILEV